MKAPHLDHLNLTVRNFAESADWYRRVFGFEVVEHGIMDGLPWGVLKSGDAHLCIYEEPDRKFVDRFALGEKGIHAFNHFALRITDRDAWRETVKREGVVVDHEWQYPHSYSWYLNDPTGYEIEVVSWNDDRPRF